MQPVHTNYKTHVIVFGIFIILTIAMTYPIAFDMGGSVSDPGDTLLNTWILSRNIDKIASGEFRHFFDANIFYPHKRTLAYSEHLFTQSLIGLPVALIFKNPLTTYNFVLLFSFATAGFGAYLLSRFITQSTFPAIISGIIFAFNPFIFDHFAHLQVVTAGGIPLSFLFLHRFLQSETYADLSFFTLYYLLQILANGYYALYLTLFCGLYIVYHIISRKQYRNYNLWLKLLIFSICVVLISGPFFYQYLAVRNEMGFIRSIAFQAKAVSYLATGPINVVYGKITAPFLTQEAALFPGLITVLLSLYAILYSVCKNRRYQPLIDHEERARNITIHHFLTGLIWIYIFLIGYIFFWGGFDFSVEIRATTLTNPLITLSVLLVIRFFANRNTLEKIPSLFISMMAFLFRSITAFFRSAALLLRSIDEYILTYLAILTLSVFFSFGDKGPYILLYKYLPGFDGLRVASRFHIFSMLALGILAGFGTKYVLQRIRTKLISVLVMLSLTTLILFEYISIPIPSVKIPVNENIPAVYKWLAKQDENTKLVELPLHDFASSNILPEISKVYYSIYHKKKIVNGYSGYFPPLYIELCKRSKNLINSVIADFRSLSVDLIVFHKDLYSKDRFDSITTRLARMKRDVQFIKKLGNAYIYKILYIPQRKETKIKSNNLKTIHISEKNWKISSNVNPRIIDRAIDGDPHTRWHSGPQKPGTFVILDMQSRYLVSGISLLLTQNIYDYPIGYAVDVSDDGEQWHRVASDNNYHPSIKGFLKPRRLDVRILFDHTQTRFLKITQTGTDSHFYWSIYEMNILSAIDANKKIP